MAASAALALPHAFFVTESVLLLELQGLCHFVMLTKRFLCFCDNFCLLYLLGIRACMQACLMLHSQTAEQVRACCKGLICKMLAEWS